MRYGSRSDAGASKSISVARAACCRLIAALGYALAEVTTEKAPRCRRKGKSWAKVSPADSRKENRKAPFPGLFQ
jgi:hypothetical protein